MRKQTEVYELTLSTLCSSDTLLVLLLVLTACSMQPEEHHQTLASLSLEMDWIQIRSPCQNGCEEPVRELTQP